MMIDERFDDENRALICSIVYYQLFNFRRVYITPHPSVFINNYCENAPSEDLLCTYWKFEPNGIDKCTLKKNGGMQRKT